MTWPTTVAIFLKRRIQFAFPQLYFFAISFPTYTDAFSMVSFETDSVIFPPLLVAPPLSLWSSNPAAALVDDDIARAEGGGGAVAPDPRPERGRERQGGRAPAGYTNE